ncbi:MAG: hypothetical protein WCX75_09155 [Fibrobacteraceae bacterium]
MIHRNSELRSVAEPQHWQSQLCRCTRLLQQSLLKVANNIIISHFSLLLLLGLARFHGRKPIFRGTLVFGIAFLKVDDGFKSGICGLYRGAAFFVRNGDF